MDLILVVDDNRDAADILASLICKLGYEARAVYSPKKAVAYAETQLYDLVFINMEMARNYGFNVVRSIQRQPGGSEIVFIGLTGLPLVAAERQVENAGYDFFLVNPIDPELLRQFLGLMAKALA